jgi:hypothetical protein
MEIRAPSVDRKAAVVRNALFHTLSWRTRRAHLVACAAVVAFAAVYLAPMMVKGWVPFDDGTLAQSAHRILMGELPHRDFDEGYTGGLSLMNAVAFRVLGENLVTLRLVLFAAILAVMPACYYIASRFASPIAAAGLCVAAAVASFPSYPAAMPSWYNLILALLGCAALLRYLEVGHRRWLFVAGLCGGLSVLIKIIGVYFIAAGALSLVFNAFGSSSSAASSSSRPRVGAMIVSFLLVALAAGPFVIMHGRLRTAEVIELGVPIVAVCACVAAQVWRTTERSGSTRSLFTLVSTGWPFAIGVVIPLVCLIIPYAFTGSLPSLYRGLLVLSQRRVDSTAEDGPTVITLVLGLPLLYLFVSPRLSARALRWYELLVVVVLEAGVVLWSAFSLNVAASLWSSIRMAAPLVVVASTVLLAASPDEPGSLLRRQQLLLLVSTAAWCALVQYPTDSYQYFLYALPLFIMVAGSLVAFRALLARTLAASTLVVFIALGMLLRPVFVAGGGSHMVLNGHPTAKLDVARGGLTVVRGERDEYVRLVSLIQQHSRSKFIYVSPDAPEVYFLAERENPTRAFFDLSDDPAGRTNRVLATIRRHQIDVVVINKQPRFSPRMPAQLHDSLADQFRDAVELRQFEVRWRSY